jgi:enoyl-[acyl-carrier protein] reductase I
LKGIRFAMIDLKGKVAVVFGLANKRSIAWGIAQKLSEAGATLAICYQNERLKKEADALIPELRDAKAYQCDVSSDAEIDSLFATLKETYGTLHAIVHAVAFAPADAIKNDFLLTTRDDFRIAHDVSVYSLIAVSRAAVPLMTEGGSILTLTYYGSTKVFPNYNVMGVAKAALEATVRYLAASLGSKNIRVNAISAGPIKTLAARGIGDFSKILEAVEQRAPLHRNVDQLEVGNAALFLSSDLASGITGEVTFVDCGYNVTGL